MCPDCGFAPKPRWRLVRHLKKRPLSCSRYKGAPRTMKGKRAHNTALRALNRSRVLRHTDRRSNVVVFQYDDRVGEEIPYAKALSAINRAWALRHGYEYRFLKKPLDSDAPPYWQKVFYAASLHKEFQVVVHLDTDACWHDPEKPVEVVGASSAFYCGVGAGFWVAQEMNAGVWISRGRQGAAIVGKWAKLWDVERSAKWSRAVYASGRPRWSCKGKWAGPAYEQGAFADLLQDWRVTHPPMGVMNSYSERQKGTCVVKHFYWEHKANIAGYVGRSHPSKLALLA